MLVHPIYLTNLITCKLNTNSGIFNLHTIPALAPPAWQANFDENGYDIIGLSLLQGIMIFTQNWHKLVQGKNFSGWNSLSPSLCHSSSFTHRLVFPKVFVYPILLKAQMPPPVFPIWNAANTHCVPVWGFPVRGFFCVAWKLFECSLKNVRSLE